MTLDQWAEACWTLLTIRPKTLKVYQGKYKNWISPTFGNRELESISRKEVQAWILTLDAVKGKEALPILKTLYREALNYEMSESNPTLGIRKKPYQKPHRDFLTWPVLDAIDFGDTYNDLFRFLATHGLRWSEAQALTQADVSEVVTVSKSIYGPTKNLQTRVVPYMGYFSDFPRSYAWARRRLQDRAGISIHSLRYTYAHSLKRAGVHPQVAQRLLGHSTITLTFDLYTRVLPDEMSSAGDALRILLADQSSAQLS